MAPPNRKAKTDIHITGVMMTPAKQDEIHAALFATLSMKLNGELDGVAITFEVVDS